MYFLRNEKVQNAFTKFVHCYCENFVCRMPRILAIDYGARRTGLAWTDPLRMFATALPGIDTDKLSVELAVRIRQGPVDTLLVGMPTRLDGRDTHITQQVAQWVQNVRTQYPSLNVILWDERFTSLLAQQTLTESGVNRKKRADKHTINSLSAVILLQHYLESPQKGLSDAP